MCIVYTTNTRKRYNMEHKQLETIMPEDYWKLTICPKCHALIYKYQTKEGKTTCVSVLEGFQYHRYGNHNNYVTPHECLQDNRQGRMNKIYVKYIEPTEEVQEKVKGHIQQQAVMYALTEFSKPRIRSSFKKSMLAQAQKFINGETTFKNPFSPKQAICILESNFNYSEFPQIVKEEVKETPITPIKKHELKLMHEIKYKNGERLVIDDDEKKADFFYGPNGKLHFTLDWIDARMDLIELLYSDKFNFTNEMESANIMVYKEV